MFGIIISQYTNPYPHHHLPNLLWVLKEWCKNIGKQVSIISISAV